MYDMFVVIWDWKGTPHVMGYVMKQGGKANTRHTYPLEGVTSYIIRGDKPSQTSITGKEEDSVQF
jgi:hypothetical protein